MQNRNHLVPWTLSLAVLSLVGLVVAGFQSPFSIDADKNETADLSLLQEATAYEADIAALNDSDVTGTATFTTSADSFDVQLNASGLAEGAHPQHIHEGSSCDDFGGVLVALEPFPEATAGGMISYQSSELSAPENLGDRTVVIHGPDGSPVACGEINPVQQ